MLNLTRPTYVMPFHGDYKRLELHGKLAEAVGIPAENIFKGENGLPLELSAKGARFGKPERAGMVFVDGVENGIFVVVATISEQDGASVAEPEVIFRGVPFPDEAENLLDDIRDTVDKSLARAAKEGVHEIDVVQGMLHDDLAQLVYERLRRRPMVLPVVVEV